MKSKLFVLLSTLMVVGLQASEFDSRLENLGEGKGNAATYAFRRIQCAENAHFLDKCESPLDTTKKENKSISPVNMTKMSTVPVSPATVTSLSPVQVVFSRKFSKSQCSSPRTLLTPVQEDTIFVEGLSSIDDIDASDLFYAIDNGKFGFATDVLKKLHVQGELSTAIRNQAKTTLLAVYDSEKASIDEKKQSGTISPFDHRKFTKYEAGVFQVAKTMRFISALNSKAVKELQTKMNNPEISEEKRSKYAREIDKALKPYR